MGFAEPDTVLCGDSYCGPARHDLLSVDYQQQPNERLGD
jgi:hypothetical protein